MLDYAKKLTLNPSSVIDADVQRLRDTGFDDEAIGAIAVITALYAFMNRVTDGLGCELPRGMDREAERLGLIQTATPE
jgi:alkylhydroperoxidase family enzyme